MYLLIVTTVGDNENGLTLELPASVVAAVWEDGGVCKWRINGGMIPMTGDLGCFWFGFFLCFLVGDWKELSDEMEPRLWFRFLGDD